MATVESVARDVLGAIDTTANHLLAGRWVAERYRQLCSRTRMRHLRRVADFVIPATISAGTVSVTNGSDLVTGDATAQAAWSSDVEGRFIRIGILWFRIVEFRSPGTLRLSVDYPEATNATATYVIAQRYVKLPREVRWLSRAFVHMRRRIPLVNMALAELDHDAPSRERVSGGPTVWVETGFDPDGSRLIELYPYSDQDELIAYVYWAEPPLLRFDDQIPAAIDGRVLKEGALIDAMRYEASIAARRGSIELAAYWRNEYRAQAAIWEREMLEAIRTDKGVDDLTLVLESRFVQRRGDISTARDIVYERWPL